MDTARSRVGRLIVASALGGFVRCPHQPRDRTERDVEAALTSRKLIGNVGRPDFGAWISRESFEPRLMVEARRAARRFRESKP